MNILSPENFHKKAITNNKQILIFIGIFWFFLLLILFKLPIEKSSTAFFPDNTKELNSMTKAMNMANLAQFIHVDFTAKDMSLEELAKHIQSFEQSLNPNFFSPAKTTALPAPENFLKLLPSLFDTNMEQAFYEQITQDKLKQAAKNTQSLLLGMSSSGAIHWLRHDPLELRSLLLQKLPQGNNLPNIDARYGYALSPNGKHLLLSLRPQKSIHDTKFAMEAMQNLEQAQAKLPSNIDANIIGAIQHTVANTKAIDADITWISIVSFLGLVGIYAIFVRSIGGLWLLLIPCFAVSIALGGAHLIFGLVSGLALGFGMSILGIAEDYAVHMYFALRSNNNKNTVFEALSMPLFQGFLLNVAGFTLLLFSAIPAVRQLSAFAILALFTGLVLALYILPLCPGFNKSFVSSNSKQNEHESQNFSVKKFPKPLPILILSVVLCVISIFIFKHLPIDVSPRSMGANAHEIQKISALFNETWKLNPSSLILIDAKNKEQALEQTAKAQKILQNSLPNVQFSSLVDILPNAKLMADNIERWNEFVIKNKDNISFGLQKNLEGMNANIIFEPFFNFLQTAPKPLNFEQLQTGPLATLAQSFLEFYPKDQSVQSRIISKAVLKIDDIPQDLQQSIILFTPEGLEQSLSQVFFTEARMLPLMFCFCLALLWVCFRNLGQTLLAALPAMMAIFCIFLAMQLLQKPLTLAGMAAMPLVLGLSIDHGIMVTHHLAKGVKLQLNKAIIVSSLTACVSMGMLAFASHPTLQAMGLVVFVGLMVEMPTSLWILPKLCKEVAKTNEN